LIRNPGFPMKIGTQSMTGLLDGVYPELDTGRE